MKKEKTSIQAVDVSNISDDANSAEIINGDVRKIDIEVVPTIVEEYVTTGNKGESNTGIYDDLDSEEDTIRRSVSFDNSSGNVGESYSNLSSFHQVVEAARKQSIAETEEDRPATCIPIITIDHVEEVDIHANANREPKQTIYRDPVTGIPLQSMKNKMHHLSVPRKGTSKRTEAKPGSSAIGHPAFLSGKIRKPMGVKRIQYLIEKRARGERRREARRQRKEKHKEDEAKRKWLRADRLRLAQDAAVEHRNATVAWT